MYSEVATEKMPTVATLKKNKHIVCSTGQTPKYVCFVSKKKIKKVKVEYFKKCNFRARF